MKYSFKKKQQCFLDRTKLLKIVKLSLITGTVFIYTSSQKTYVASNFFASYEYKGKAAKSQYTEPLNAL